MLFNAFRQGDVNDECAFYCKYAKYVNEKVAFW